MIETFVDIFVMTWLTKADEKMLWSAISQAELSPVLMRHGCVAVRNGKIVSSGFNNYRTYSKDGVIRNTCTCHAEADVIHKLNNLGIKDFAKITLYIVRINPKGATRESAPCKDCYEMIKAKGIRKFIYTTNSGIQKTTVKDFVPTQITTGRNYLNKLKTKGDKNLIKTDRASLGTNSS
jgi:deoxycytidylate deaminase